MGQCIGLNPLFELIVVHNDDMPSEGFPIHMPANWLEITQNGNATLGASAAWHLSSAFLAQIFNSNEFDAIQPIHKVMFNLSKSNFLTCFPFVDSNTSRIVCLAMMGRL